LLSVHQAALLDRLALDAFPFEENRLTSTEIDVGRREIVQALVIAPMIVVADEGLDLPFKVARQVIVFQQDACPASGPMRQIGVVEQRRISGSS
jgi:hypothetical protein